MKVIPHDYKRALAEPVSAGGGGFFDHRVRTEDEEAGVMGRHRGFLQPEPRRGARAPPAERIGDYREFVGTLPLVELREQAARCMECGVPFCHHGCPLGNLIPDWNDLVYRDRWQEAIEQLHRTNNFPEFTGRLCPAPCEAACVLEINEGNAVSIKQVELAIVNRALGRGVDRAAARGAPHRPQRRRRRLRARRASRARSSSRAPARTSSSTSATSRPAA